MKNLARVAHTSLRIAVPAITQTTGALPWSGTRGLMVAVLEDAIQSLKSPEGVVRAAAERWIASGERRYIFSFAVICETLDFEPIAIRRSVIRLLDKKQRSPRLIKRSRSNVRHAATIQMA